MAAPDLEIISGTTFGFEVTWESAGESRTPVDVSGCTVRFQVSSGSSLLLESTTENGGIAVSDPAAGRIAVQVKPSQTAGQDPDEWELAAYELRVYFPSGDVYSILRGRAALLMGAIRD